MFTCMDAVFTEANVGIINTNPIHTLDVGSNLYVDDLASNVLVVRGSVDIYDDLIVKGQCLCRTMISGLSQVTYY